MAARQSSPLLINNCRLFPNGIQVHVPQPYPVHIEKIVEKKVPYPVEKIVEKKVFDLALQA
jgi:hypothetical protein